MHIMMTSWHGNALRIVGPIVQWSQIRVNEGLHYIFAVSLNKLSNKKSKCSWRAEVYSAPGMWCALVMCWEVFSVLMLSSICKGWGAGRCTAGAWRYAAGDGRCGANILIRCKLGWGSDVLGFLWPYPWGYIHVDSESMGQYSIAWKCDLAIQVKGSIYAIYIYIRLCGNIYIAIYIYIYICIYIKLD